MYDTFSILAQAEPVLQRMDQSQRVRVAVALAAVAMLGLVMIFLVWLAGRAVRRYMKYEPFSPKETELVPDDWARKPLVPEDPPTQEES